MYNWLCRVIPYSGNNLSLSKTTKSNFSCILCLFRLGYTVEKMPTSWFHLSEDRANRFALSVASSWNFAVNALKSLAEGNNSVLFFKVYTKISCIKILYLVNLIETN